MTRDLEGWDLTEDEARMLNHRERKEYLDTIKRGRTRQGQFDRTFLHLDQPLTANGRMLEVSDRGKAAAEIRAACDDAPRWRILWEQARKKLTKKQKRILDALLVDFRTTKAAEAARVTERSIQLFKKTFFKKHFNQCFREWKRDFE